MLAVLASCQESEPKRANQRTIPERFVPGSFVMEFSDHEDKANLSQEAKSVAEKAGCDFEKPEDVIWSQEANAAISEEAAKTVSIRFRNCELDRNATKDVIDSLSKIAGAEAVKADALSTIAPVENDPLKERQVFLNLINRDQACKILGANSKVIKVAVVDTGIDLNHPDLKNSILRDDQGEIVAANFVGKGAQGAPDKEVNDGVGHGTHVSGIIAAQANNDEGTVGVASCANVKIIPVRVLGNDGSGSYLEIERGIQWAADHGAQIINLSLGHNVSYPRSEKPEFDNWLYRDLAGQNIMVFAAAGNDGFVNGSEESGARIYSYPASYDHVIAVAATTTTGQLTDFSVRGERIDIAAPGSRILSTYKGSDYEYLDGTSMASPVAAGAYALALAKVVDRLGALDRVDVATGEQALVAAILPGRALSSLDTVSKGVLNAEDLVSRLDKDMADPTKASELASGNASDPAAVTMTSPDPQIPLVLPTTGDFAFAGLVEGMELTDFSYVSVKDLPQGTAWVTLYWGDSRTAFTVIRAGETLSSGQTSSRWIFSGTHRLRAYALDRNGMVLKKISLLIKGI
jgi:subtilisin family serine protease